MKKLKLKALELGANELLSREQLKNVLGGDGSGGGSGSGCWSSSCYKCCTPDLKTCGQCNTSGSGGCLGNGTAMNCIY